MQMNTHFTVERVVQSFCLVLLLFQFGTHAISRCDLLVNVLVISQLVLIELLLVFELHLFLSRLVTHLTDLLQTTHVNHSLTLSLSSLL